MTDTQVHNTMPHQPKYKSYIRYSTPAARIISDPITNKLATHLRYQSKLSGYHSRSGLFRPAARTCGSPLPLLPVIVIHDS